MFDQEKTGWSASPFVPFQPWPLTEDGGDEPVVTVVGCLRETLFAPDAAEVMLARMASAATRIVSLTVTEKGYGHDPATGDLTNPAILADLAGSMPPRSTLGWLVAGGSLGGVTRPSTTAELSVLTCLAWRVCPAGDERGCWLDGGA